ncbi:MAG: hypothetical protein ACRYFZ_26925 [Janthinobacterium lividum]
MARPANGAVVVVRVPPGEVLTVVVGGQGASGNVGTLAGGFNGGGSGGYYGGGGAGADNSASGNGAGGGGGSSFVTAAKRAWHSSPTRWGRARRLRLPGPRQVPPCW